MSEGKFEDIRPIVAVKKNEKDIDESTDTWDTVDWLVKNVPGLEGNAFAKRETIKVAETPIRFLTRRSGELRASRERFGAGDRLPGRPR